MDAMDHGKQPVAGMESSHRSSVLPMLGMISYRLGRSLQWDSSRETILGDPEALSLMKRSYRTPWAYPLGA